MIPKADIAEWRNHIKWKSDTQVEQDLILSRILVILFDNPLISQKLVFRGGTALHKLTIFNLQITILEKGRKTALIVYDNLMMNDGLN
jgi:hypothetical protein